MKVQVLVITFVFAIVIAHVKAAVAASERSDATIEFAPTEFQRKEFKLEYYAQANWFNAWLACLNCGMRLASINSQQEQNVVEQLMIEYGLAGSNIWIAGNDLATEGRFNWYTSGEIFRYTNWGPNEPNNLNDEEDCVEIRGGSHGKMWNDKNCTTLNFYLCEKSFECS